MSRPPLKKDRLSMLLAFRVDEDEGAEFERLLALVGKGKSEVLRPLLQKWMRQVKSVQDLKGATKLRSPRS